MFKKKKEEEEMEEELKEEPQPEEEQQQLPQQQPQILEDRYYLMVVNDGESQETLVIKGKNILLAMIKFAREYNDVCSEWLGLNISIEEVEALE